MEISTAGTVCSAHSQSPFSQGCADRLQKQQLKAQHESKGGELAPAERICEEEGLTCLFRRQLLWQGLVRRGNERCSSNAHLGLLDAHVYFCQPFHLSALLKTQPFWRDI